MSHSPQYDTYELRVNINKMAAWWRAAPHGTNQMLLVIKMAARWLPKSCGAKRKVTNDQNGCQMTAAPRGGTKPNYAWDQDGNCRWLLKPLGAKPKVTKIKTNDQDGCQMNATKPNLINDQDGRPTWWYQPESCQCSRWLTQKAPKNSVVTSTTFYHWFSSSIYLLLMYCRSPELLELFFSSFLYTFFLKRFVCLRGRSLLYLKLNMVIHSDAEVIFLVSRELLIQLLVSKLWT